MSQRGFILFILILFIFLNSSLSLLLLQFIKQEARANAISLAECNSKVVLSKDSEAQQTNLL